MDARAAIAITDVFRQAGWLADGACPLPQLQPAQDLLPYLATAVLNSCPHQHIRRWFDEGAERGDQLLVWPLRVTDTSTSQTRLLWCPGGLSHRRRIALLSSHLGQRPYELREWFQLLRQILAAIPFDHQVVTAKGTTVHPWVNCAAKEFPFGMLFVEWPKQTTEQRGLARWLQALVRRSPRSVDASRNVVALSPTLPRSDNIGIHDNLVADEALLQLADEVHVMRLLKRGKLRHAIEKHLRSGDAFQLVHLSIGDRLVPSDLAASLVTRGCHARPHPQAPASDRRIILQRPLREATHSIAREPMLTHWTRGARGPWPDQTEEQFRRGVLFDHADADHGALATLLRMLTMRRLCASKNSIRGGHAAVCFTSVPFEEWSAHQVYRRHRCRWDFSPYGISISRRWLEAHGARPVIYGDAETWQQIDAADRPYFQMSMSGGATSGGCDWRKEREWRVIGDVDLSNVPADQAWVFVPTAIEGRWVSFVSRWPVRILAATRPAPSRPSESAQ